MKFYKYLYLLAVFTISLPQTAQAKSWADWLFTPPVPDFRRPYLEDGKTPHLSVRPLDPALVDGWIARRGGMRRFMNDLYADDVIRGWNSKKDVPVLKIGRTFMNLSPQDRQNIALFVDKAYGVTQKNPQGMFALTHWRNGATIGVYTRRGLQLQ